MKNNKGKTKEYPKLEKIRLSEYSQFSTIEPELAKLARNQEIIYSLLKVIAEKIWK